MQGIGEEGGERPPLPSNPSSRRKALDDQLFQPPGISASDAKRLASGSANGDDQSSVHSRKSSRSLGSWTVKLFTGNTQTPKDGSDSEASRGKSDNLDKAIKQPGTPKSGMSAVAALKKINGNAVVPPGRTASAGSGTVRINRPREGL
jgi:hypothetical protein